VLHSSQFASLSEGFPNALAEAMSFSLPSIAYNCIAGPSDLIEDGVNGYLVPLNNKIEYKEKFEALLSDKELRTKMGTIARQSIKNFDR
jgi:GalNAc-alpha-(1->4)-GalNAc-alpha-(1->3)-diNAcBac-PP-undecaprenol alpha-1,4-N-acetyl-D-galactosaminyltransferase